MSQSLPEITYTPESRLRHPFRLIRTMFIDLWRSRELAWRLLVRDISAQYRQTLLGLFWAFLPLIATTGVFVMLNKGKVRRYISIYKSERRKADEELHLESNP